MKKHRPPLIHHTRTAYLSHPYGLSATPVRLIRYTRTAYLPHPYGLFTTLSDLERLNEVHEQRDEEQTAGGQLTELPPCRDIELDDVTFSYSGADRDYALEHVSITIPQHTPSG